MAARRSLCVAISTVAWPASAGDDLRDDQFGVRVEVLARFVEKHQRHRAGGDPVAGPQHRAG